MSTTSTRKRPSRQPAAAPPAIAPGAEVRYTPSFGYGRQRGVVERAAQLRGMWVVRIHGEPNPVTVPEARLELL